MENLLEIKDLHVSFKTYDGILKVLNGINLNVGVGEKVSVVGETGCGKTTTLKSVMRLLARNAIVDDGEIYFKGENLLTISNKKLNQVRNYGIGMIFQDPTAALNPVFTLGEQLEEILKANGIKKNRKKDGIDALKLARLPDAERMYESYPFQLSGGMRQRACIAMALSTKKELLFADEPTTNLDVTIQDQVLRLINKLYEERQMSLVLITHSLGVAREVADRVYVMYAGSIIESGKTREIFDNPKHPYTIGLIKSLPKLTGEEMAKGIPGRIPNYLHPPAGCRFYPRCQHSKSICKEKKPEMIEVDDNHYVSCFRYK